MNLKKSTNHFCKQFVQTVQYFQEDKYGVPQQYGLYFSMGLALVMEVQQTVKNARKKM